MQGRIVGLRRFLPEAVLIDPKWRTDSRLLAPYYRLTPSLGSKHIRPGRAYTLGNYRLSGALSSTVVRGSKPLLLRRHKRPIVLLKINRKNAFDQRRCVQRVAVSRIEDYFTLVSAPKNGAMTVW